MLQKHKHSILLESLRQDLCFRNLLWIFQKLNFSRIWKFSTFFEYPLKLPVFFVDFDLGSSFRPYFSENSYDVSRIALWIIAIFRIFEEKKWLSNLTFLKSLHREPKHVTFFESARRDLCLRIFSWIIRQLFQKQKKLENF